MPLLWRNLTSCWPLWKWSVRLNAQSSYLWSDSTYQIWNLVRSLSFHHSNTLTIGSKRKSKRRSTMYKVWLLVLSLFTLWDLGQNTTGRISQCGWRRRIHLRLLFHLLESLISTQKIFADSLSTTFLWRRKLNPPCKQTDHNTHLSSCVLFWHPNRGLL